MEMPVMAANTALAATVARPRPPRMRRKSHWNTSNVSRPTPDTLTSMPMSTKSGMTPNK